MPGYFDQRRSLKSMIKYTSDGIKRLEKVRAKQELAVEHYRNMLFNKNFMEICNNPRHPKFYEAQDMKQQGFRLFGESKYLLLECNYDIKDLQKRQKLYKQWMQPFID